MIVTVSLSGQKFEIFGGINNNKFHDFIKDNHYRSAYKADYGYTAGFGIDSIKFDWLKLRFTLQFDKYKGNLQVSYGGLGGDQTTVADFEKSLISLCIFPVNFRFFNKVDLNLGFQVSRLITETFNGTSSGWILYQPNWSYTLQDKYDRYSATTYFGLQGRIACDFNLSKSICVTPQYLYYFGLSDEFVEFPEETKSMRHHLCVGIKKRFI